VADDVKGWQADPFGTHELRYFANDGRPTGLVSNGGVTSQDHMPIEAIDRWYRSKLGDGGQDASTALQGAEGGPSPTRKRSTGSPHRVRVQHPTSPRSASNSVEPATVPFKIGFGMVIALIVVSAASFAYVHFERKKPAHPRHKESVVTTSSVGTTTTTLPPLPASLMASPESAASSLVASWAAGNRASALSVATAPAVTTLFAAHYSSGLVIDRGCSDAFSPIVCTYGPPGGAPPTDPIYEIDVTKAPGGWYVSSTRIEN
jgi:hypothetical protein